MLNRINYAYNGYKCINRLLRLSEHLHRHEAFYTFLAFLQAFLHHPQPQHNTIKTTTTLKHIQSISPLHWLHWHGSNPASPSARADTVNIERATNGTGWTCETEREIKRNEFCRALVCNTPPQRAVRLTVPSAICWTWGIGSGTARCVHAAIRSIDCTAGHKTATQYGAISQRQAHPAAPTLIVHDVHHILRR